MDKTLSLRELTNEYARVNFCWGVHDCCQFVSQHIANVLNIPNPAWEYRYETESGAQEYLDREGGVEGICTVAVGKEPVGKDKLNTGDVCLVDLPITGDALGLVSVRQKTAPITNGFKLVPWLQAIVVSEHGLIMVPENRIKKGWAL